MSRFGAHGLLAVLAALPAAGTEPPSFPSGTSQFFRTYAAAAIPAQGGGVWIALPLGIVRYTAAGAGSVLPTPSGAPYRLALAPDGSIWFANATGVGRISTSGTLLEQYTVAGIAAITVASDGALWYARTSGSIVGRIAGRTSVEFTSPTDVWSLAPASDGAVWLLGQGFGTSADLLHRMSSTGAVTVLPLGADVLYGTLQALPDGTLYIGTGYRNGLLRLRPGSSSFEVVLGFRDSMFLVNDAHNVWSATYSVLNYLAANEVFRVALQLPYDPRVGKCSNLPAWAYRPLAIDSEGGLWLGVFDDAFYLPLPLPCNLPQPPEMPTLIRIDAAALIAPHNVPTLLPLVLVSLAALIAAMGVLRLRAL